jgi:CRP-like cAMP-binding protein
MLRSPHPTERLLASVSLFDGLKARDLRQLAPYVESTTARAGQALIHEDLPNQFTYIVVTGRLDVLVDGERVAGVGPDEIVGERTLLGERRANATVTAAVDSEVLVLDHRALRVITAEHPEIADRLQGVVAARAAA